MPLQECGKFLVVGLSLARFVPQTTKEGEFSEFRVAGDECVEKACSVVECGKMTRMFKCSKKVNFSLIRHVQVRFTRERLVMVFFQCFFSSQ